MSNIKQYTIAQLCDDLTKAFGEDCPVAEAGAERNISRQGDCIMGYFRVEDFTIKINIRKILPDGQY